MHSRSPRDKATEEERRRRLRITPIEAISSPNKTWYHSAMVCLSSLLTKTWGPTRPLNHKKAPPFTITHAKLCLCCKDSVVEVVKNQQTKIQT